jgi:ureidoacrylate peracid hydrolase
MANVTYDKQLTALLVIDPYNDFISEGGKIWGRLKAVAEVNGCVSHMLQVLNAARKAGLRVFYALHHRYRPGDYETWEYIAPVQAAAWRSKAFENGTWGGEIRSEFAPQPGDIVALEHWGSSGFANTDLDLLLKRHGIRKLIVIGLIVHTCVEATVRFAAELGYDVTVVRDATADYSDEEMHAALDVNIPNYASAIVTTDQIVDSISSLPAEGASRTTLVQAPGHDERHCLEPSKIAGCCFAVPARAVYQRASYQGIEQHHRPIDPTPCVWRDSLRALLQALRPSHRRPGLGRGSVLRGAFRRGPARPSSPTPGGRCSARTRRGSE